MVVLVYAHPYPTRSLTNRRLLEAVRDLDGLDVRVLYDLYPDFSIDVDAEQAALDKAQAVVWQHPLYWYSVPPLLKLWLDKVLARGWAYGEGGTALRGKRCLWVVSAGGDEAAYSAGGMHGHGFESFVAPMQQTAKFCGMLWEGPLVVLGAHGIDREALDDACRRYRDRLSSLLALPSRRADRA
jgi:glutathione-regulated potassium-efflux system ancillary protein KefF